jgi:hypothetical protein
MNYNIILPRSDLALMPSTYLFRKTKYGLKHSLTAFIEITLIFSSLLFLNLLILKRANYLALPEPLTNNLFYNCGIQLFGFLPLLLVSFCVYIFTFKFLPIQRNGIISSKKELTYYKLTNH